MGEGWKVDVIANILKNIKHTKRKVSENELQKEKLY